MNMKVLIIGMGLSGRGAAELLLKRGCEVIGVDSKAEEISSSYEIQDLEKRGVFVFSDKEPIDISKFDEIILSPGISQKHPMVQKALSLRIPVIGESELTFRHLGNQRSVAITGTNGKTTVTLLVTHILNQSGLKARALGNVGVPFSQVAHQLEPDEIIVAELSSFQLETLSIKAFDAAVILNITPDHLDRYESLEEYAMAKSRLQNCLKPSAPFYVFSQTAKEYAHLFTEEFISFGEDLSCQLWTDGRFVKDGDDLRFTLPSETVFCAKHDFFNVLAAWGLCKQFGVTQDQFCLALLTFKKPSHRLEFVANIDGVFYYDDSKGTNVDAVIQSVGAMQGPVILIAGGVDKGHSYCVWNDVFKGKVKELFVLGQAAEKIRKELGPFFKVTVVNSLSEAVDKASCIAIDGDTVLLSPGCSSFDMFRDYAHRGREFQKCVNQLEERSKKI